MTLRPQVVSLNLANARRDEVDASGKLTSYRFGLRANDIKSALSADRFWGSFLCLSELRNCRAWDPNIHLHPSAFIQSLTQSEGQWSVAILEPNNTSYMSFWKATLYNEFMWRHLDSFGVSIGPADIPSLTFENRVLFSRFTLNLDVNYTPFWIVNVHFPYKDQVLFAKWLTTNIPKEIAEHGGASNEMVIMIGDWNTFFDIDGAEQLQILRDAGWIIPHHNTPTFKSFPQDTFQCESILDHAGVLNLPEECEAYFESDPVDHTISDHAIVCLWFENCF